MRGIFTLNTVSSQYYSHCVTPYVMTDGIGATEASRNEVVEYRLGLEQFRNVTADVFEISNSIA